MDLFKEQWEKQVRVLTDAVDDITSIDDFLAVSGNQEFNLRNNNSHTELIPGNGWFLHVFWSLLGFLEGMVLVHFTWQASSSAERGVKIEQEILARGEEVFL